MARLQILELPEGSNDDRPPFVLVVDQVPTDEAGFDALRRDLGTPDDLLERIGARAVLVFEDTIDIPANDTSGYLREAEATRTPVDEMEVLRQQARHSEEAEAIRKRVSKEQKTALTDALGMDRLRDWDDILNAARGIRTQRDAQAETLEQVRRLPEQPEAIDAKQPFPPAEYLNGYASAMRAAKRSTYPPQPTEAGETGPATDA
ncbi:hypothetical protein ACFYWD_20860 [Streptomyces sp. NPDC003781]|uniref:hypothetical protein n=1 Tax=Streptomyces sp. NPDC003781 TaxID=3364686 RepID=UPI0036866320